MPAETEEQTTTAFQVQREDGARYILTEVTTFLVHEGDGRRVPHQIEWFVDGKSVIRDRHVFRNLATGDVFRILREGQVGESRRIAVNIATLPELVRMP